MKTAEVTTKTKWVIDPSHSEISFRVKHLMITNVKGVFNEFDANIYTNNDDSVLTNIDFTMNAGSVNTGDEKRDAHLRSADFFNVEKNEKITFSATPCVNLDRDAVFEVEGDLTMNGITRKIKLDVEFGGMMKDPWGNLKAGFAITGKINRKEWGLTWNAGLETGGVLVSDEVRINCDVQLLKQAFQS
jgi:polyisoprenoid-binding protein YceI